MGTTCLNSFCDCWLIQVFAGFKIVLYLTEYPWITNSRATNHHAINTIFQSPVGCLFRRVDIAIAKNRYLYAGVLFYITDEGPIGHTLVHLRTCTAMDSKR